MRRKLPLDLAMMALILLSFAWQLTGNTLHELLGFGLFALFIAHNLALNRAWYAGLPKGKYRARRVVGTVVNLLLLLDTLTLLLSGAIDSRLLAEALGLRGNLLPRAIHTTTAYWFLVLMSIHLGLHWRLVMAETRKRAGLRLAAGGRLALLRLVALAIVTQGVYAAFERHLADKLMARFSFDYWDFGQSVWGYFGHYLAIVGVFVFLAHYGSNRRGEKRRPEIGPKTEWKSVTDDIG